MCAILIDRRTFARLFFTRSRASLPSRTLQMRQELHRQCRSVRSILCRIDHTFSMARERSNLRKIIKDLDTEFQTQETTENNTETQDSGHCVGPRQKILRHTLNDIVGTSPRAGYIRRRAAVCLQRHVRGRAVRMLFRDRMWAVMHLRGAGEPLRLVAYYG